MENIHNGYVADGHRIYRPAKNHPNPEHWANIRRLALLRDGKACRTCWRTARNGYSLECHHRHYDNWGHERLEDVVILCIRCHDLHTNDVREARYAYRQTISPPTVDIPSEVYVPYRRKETEVPSYKTPTAVFIPNRRVYRL